MDPCVNNLMWYWCSIRTSE